MENRRFILFILFSFAIGGLSLFPARDARAEPTPVVVELFTSQGCSSCPPAEALLRDLAVEPDILALEFHVDYWDYLGWADPYADPAFTHRQRAYARYFNSQMVYTPQMVFQGMSETAGSRKGRVMEHIAAAQALQKTPVSATVSATRQIALEIDAHSQRVDATLLLVAYDDYRETRITRGENAGKFLSHRHVVRAMASLGSWDGSPLSLMRAIPESMPEGTGYAVLIQSKGNGHILGAARLAPTQ